MFNFFVCLLFCVYTASCFLSILDVVWCLSLILENSCTLVSFSSGILVICMTDYLILSHSSWVFCFIHSFFLSLFVSQFE